ncbi:MAG: hypothetical protein QXH27_00835 [Candidatus Micrarchaeia archaeon]
MKAQAAMEYLMSYGWAIVIIVVALAVLVYLGVFSAGGKTPDICSFPPGIQCRSFRLEVDGSLNTTIYNGLSDKIIVTGVACTAEQPTAQGEPPVWESTNASIDAGYAGPVNFAACRLGDGTTATGKLGDTYRGRLYIRYHLQSEGSASPRVIRGDISAGMQPAT